MANIIGTVGNDTLQGTVEDDLIKGLAGNDLLEGLSGSDTLNPGQGRDTVEGGEGDDRLVLDNRGDTANTSYTYTDFQGTISGGKNNGTTFSGIESFTLRTGSSNDYINLLPQNDWFYTDNFIDGGNGNDTIYGNDLLDYFAYEIEETIRGGQGNDLLIGGDSINNLYGDQGNDTLQGRLGNDYLTPGSGRDDVNGGAGTDILKIDNSNSSANVTINYTSNDNGTITGGENNGTTFRNVEKFRIQTGSGNDIINVPLARGLSVDFDFDAVIINGGAGNDRITGGRRCYNEVQGGPGNDTITGGNSDRYPDLDSLVGGPGDDYIIGLLGGGESWGDELFGNQGNDTLVGAGGDDYFEPGVGRDSVVGGAGIDVLAIDNPNDTANIVVNYTDLQNGRITGGRNNGTTFKQIEKVILTMGSGNDDINISAIPYMLQGTYALRVLRTNIKTGVGNDQIISGGLSDQLYGDPGDDYLVGGRDAPIYSWNYEPSESADELYGGTGNDTLIGVDPNSIDSIRNDYDYLQGDEGSDLYVLGDSQYVYYDNFGDQEWEDSEQAVIRTFNPTEDRIQLHGQASDYSWEGVGIISSIGLYLNQPDAPIGELIATFEGLNTGFDLNSATVVYV